MTADQGGKLRVTVQACNLQRLSNHLTKCNVVGTLHVLQAEVQVLALLPSGGMVSVDMQGNIAHWSLPDADNDQPQQPLQRFKLPQHLLLPCPQYVLQCSVRVTA